MKLLFHRISMEFIYEPNVQNGMKTKENLFAQFLSIEAEKLMKFSNEEDEKTLNSSNKNNVNEVLKNSSDGISVLHDLMSQLGRLKDNYYHENFYNLIDCKNDDVIEQVKSFSSRKANTKLSLKIKVITKQFSKKQRKTLKPIKKGLKSCME